jgi:hypothetical protein
VVVLESKKGYEVLARFENGKMYCGNWESPLRGDLYVIGRYGYAKIEREAAEPRPASSRFSDYVSRVQLLVRPREDRIEILDVGLNPVKVLPYEMGKNEKGRKEKRFGKSLDNTFAWRDRNRNWFVIFVFLFKAISNKFFHCKLSSFTTFLSVFHRLCYSTFSCKVL